MDTDSSSSILPSSGDQQNNAESCTGELSTAESLDSNKTNIDQDCPMLEPDKHQDISISSITVDLSDKSENTDGYLSSCDTDAIGITAHDDNLETNDPCNEDRHTLNKLCSVSNDKLSHIKSPLQQDSSTKTVTESQDNTFLSQVSALNLENISSEPDSLTVLTHKDTSTSCSMKDPSIRIKMLARVAVSDAHFKHQQRGEPDLTMEEKIEIAQNILDENPVTFLSRFHNYLELEDLDYFKDSRDIYEVDFYCKQIYKSKSGSYHKNCVKNRRYEAMKQLISEGDYFSEEEMKFREPYLYDQMIGRFLSDEEVQAKVDKADLRFSSILIRHIDILDENVRFAREKDKEVKYPRSREAKFLSAKL